MIFTIHIHFLRSELEKRLRSVYGYSNIQDLMLMMVMKMVMIRAEMMMMVSMRGEGQKKETRVQFQVRFTRY